MIAEIAKEYKASPAHVLIAWVLYRGTPAIPKSVSPKRQGENLKAAQLKLEAQDMEVISTLGKNGR